MRGVLLVGAGAALIVASMSIAFAEPSGNEPAQQHRQTPDQTIPTKDADHVEPGKVGLEAKRIRRSLRRHRIFPRTSSRRRRSIYLLTLSSRRMALANSMTRRVRPA